MALKTTGNTSPHKTELKNPPSGNTTFSLDKGDFTPKKVASGNVSSGPLKLKTEPTSGGLK